MAMTDVDKLDDCMFNSILSRNKISKEHKIQPLHFVFYALNLVTYVPALTSPHLFFMFRNCTSYFYVLVARTSIAFLLSGAQFCITSVLSVGCYTEF